MKRIWLCAAFFAMLAGSLQAQDYSYKAVPPLSSVKRLPNSDNSDGKTSATVSFIAAKGETESASFVLTAPKDVKKVVLTPSALKNAAGKTIPASAIDLKIVKVWVQAGCGWHSYFADATGRTLVPELLLNDENLVKVDTGKMENFLRVVKSKRTDRIRMDKQYRRYRPYRSPHGKIKNRRRRNIPAVHPR